MKITTDFLLISQSTIVDKSDGSLSVMNITEGIETPDIPFEINGLRISSRFSIKDNGKASEAELTFGLEGPDGKLDPITKPGVQYMISLKPEMPYQKSGIILTANCGIRMEGRHFIKVFLKDKEIASQDINIIKI